MPQTTISKIKEKKSYSDKIGDFEELLPGEEAAIEEGRKAYARGEWVNLSELKNGMAGSRNKARAKKS